MNLPTVTALAQPLADSDHGKGSPIGLFVVLLLVVATYLLYRSMSGHVRRLPERFPGYRTADGDAASGDDAAEPAGAAPDAAVRPANPDGEGGERTGPS